MLNVAQLWISVQQLMPCSPMAIKWVNAVVKQFSGALLKRTRWRSEKEGGIVQILASHCMSSRLQMDVSKEESVPLISNDAIHHRAPLLEIRCNSSISFRWIQEVNNEVFF